MKPQTVPHGAIPRHYLAVARRLTGKGQAPMTVTTLDDAQPWPEVRRTLLGA